MSDVQSAAERLRAKAQGIVDAYESMNALMPFLESDGTDSVLDASVDVARAWLAENPADDGEPITPEWLRSVGFEDMVTDVKMRIKSATWKDSHDHYRHTQLGFVGEDWYANGLGCAPCKTRGDVRRACAVLGIPLTP